MTHTTKIPTKFQPNKLQLLRNLWMNASLLPYSFMSFTPKHVIFNKRFTMAVVLWSYDFHGVNQIDCLSWFSVIWLVWANWTGFHQHFGILLNCKPQFYGWQHLSWVHFPNFSAIFNIINNNKCHNFKRKFNLVHF